MRYRTELIWPPFKGKAHKVVDSTTGTGVGLYRTAEGARRKARAMNVAAATGIVHAPDVAARVEYEPAEPVKAPDLYTCKDCGQAPIPARLVTATPNGGVYTVPPRCETCTAAERAPQGESMRLFTPAPTQLDGQLSL